MMFAISRKVKFASVLTLSLTTPWFFSACAETTPTKPAKGGIDDGSQLENSFRINYAGYLPLQDKIAVFLSDKKKPRDWELLDANGKVVAQGLSNDRRENDHASGDTFFLIDFSSFKKEGEGYTLKVDGKTSEPFAITNDPYKGLKYEFFDYFKDHRRSGDVFNRFVGDWTEHSVSFDFIADAGDQGYYTVNAAEAQWSLINLLETYPEINEYYSKASSNYAKVYDELVYMNSPMEHVIFPGQKLAAAKFANLSNDTWAPCPGAHGKGGPCVSRVETKATYSVARTLASMARLHAEFGSKELMKKHYDLAKIAFNNAESEPYVCLKKDDFGGEGGYYPNNDNHSLWRDPEGERDACADGPKADPKDNNINDDQYAAMVELYIAASEFGLKKDAEAFKEKVEGHKHHLRIDKFYFGAISPEATMSLLANRPTGMDLSKAEANVFKHADQVLKFQKVGYPGVTFDTKSNEWDVGDQDDVDNNFRWGSNRMQLNEARIVMYAAELAFKQKRFKAAAAYTNAVLKVLDQISGTNGVALAMYTADSYPFIEQPITRTHDALVSDEEDGKMILGANNWTNANDPAMPKFGSMPGMKMFALTGTGWASREISIDANASLIPVVYFATERAPMILEAAKKKR